MTPGTSDNIHNYLFTVQSGPVWEQLWYLLLGNVKQTLFN